MTYKIQISQSAFRELKQLQKPAIKKIGQLIESLAENPRPSGVKKLKAVNEDLYRVRAGDYRVVYAVDDTIRIVDIRKIGHRKDIYK